MEILKMKDASESFRVKKEKLFDLPLRLLVVGKSAYAGKTNWLGNAVLRPYDESDKTGKEFYKNDFNGENIYIFCPSKDLDQKWRAIIKGKKIPESNVYSGYDEEEMTALYEKLHEQYLSDVASGKKPKHTLVILDDCSFDGSLVNKRTGAISRLFCQGRHQLISTIATSQKYSQVSTTARENCTGCILFDCSQKQLELIHADHGLGKKQDFIELFRKATEEPHSFLVINYSNTRKNRFQDKNFNPM